MKRYAVQGAQRRGEDHREFFLFHEMGPLPAAVKISSVVKTVYTQEIAETFAAEMNARTPNTTWTVVERHYI